MQCVARAVAATITAAVMINQDLCVTTSVYGVQLETKIAPGLIICLLEELSAPLLSIFPFMRC